MYLCNILRNYDVKSGHMGSWNHMGHLQAAIRRSCISLLPGRLMFDFKKGGVVYSKAAGHCFALNVHFAT